MLIVVLAILAAARLAFAAVHASGYLLLARRFRHVGSTGLAKLGRGMSLLATALPLLGVAWTIDAAMAIWRETPPGGWRRAVEIPALVGGLAALELIPAAVVMGALTGLLLLARRRLR